MSQAFINAVRQQVSFASATYAIHTRIEFTSFGVFNRGIPPVVIHPGYDAATR